MMPFPTSDPGAPPSPAAAVTPTRAGELYEAWRASGQPRPRSRLLFGALAALGAVLNGGVFWLSGILLFAGRPVAPPADRQMTVPFAADRELWDRYRRWPVQEDGRVKPFDTFCREAVRTITGRERFEENDPVAVVVAWMMAPPGAKDDWDHYPLIHCDLPALRELLYREQRGAEEELTEQERHGKGVEPALLRESATFKKLVRQAAVKRMEDGKAPLSPLEVKAQEAHDRLKLYERISQGDAFGVAALDQNGPTWFSLRSVHDLTASPGEWKRAVETRRAADPAPYEGQPEQSFPEAEAKEVRRAFEAARQAYRDDQSGSGGADHFGPASAELLDTLQRIGGRFDHTPDPKALALELWFNRVNPFRWAWVAGLGAALLLAGGVLVGRRRTSVRRCLYAAGLLIYAGALGGSVVGFYCRVSISGRPPVSNMYESIIWVAFMAAVFGLLLEVIDRRGVLALAGALVSALGLLLADQMPLTFSPAIQPLQAVLRSNYWLTIHVLTIVSSYAAFALAWALGNGNLGLMILAPHRGDLIRTLSQLGYRAIQLGVVLLAAGTLLGGFWAAESWGRFWGWDPKEVWALIALLCYLIPLHARYVGWVGDFGLAVGAVVCFAAVVMAWYGVNFVLGAGLHSYGFGGGRDAWVYGAGLLNLDGVVLAALRYLYYPRGPKAVREFA